ncbi:MAG: hypothetical protein U1A77_10990 [Pirellulales bacterium]
MLSVKLSDKPCLFCGAKDDTIFTKSKEQDFSGNVCSKHLIGLLKRWEEAPVAGKEGDHAHDKGREPAVAGKP